MSLIHAIEGEEEDGRFEELLQPANLPLFRFAPETVHSLMFADQSMWSRLLEVEQRGQANSVLDPLGILVPTYEYMLSFQQRWRESDSSLPIVKKIYNPTERRETKKSVHSVDAASLTFNVIILERMLWAISQSNATPDNIVMLDIRRLSTTFSILR